jgi:hypothetical protein
MPVLFPCPCGQQLRVPEEYVGKKVRCPSCLEVQQIPAPKSPNPIEPILPVAIQAETPAHAPVGQPPVAEDRDEAAVLDVIAVNDTRKGRGRDRRGKKEEISAFPWWGWLIVGVTCTAFLIGAVVLLMLPSPASRVREAAARVESQNNLKQMGLAFFNVDLTNGHLPPAVVHGKDLGRPDLPDKPLFSWRVALLPYLDEQALYNSFNLHEPWDSPHNLQVAQAMPRVYRNPSRPDAPPGMTYYKVFTGPKAVWDGNRPVSFRHNFPKGTSNTVLVVEAAEPVFWTKPEDIPFTPETDPIPLLGWDSRGNCQAILADGSSRSLSKTLSVRTLKAVILAGSDDIPGPDW